MARIRTIKHEFFYSEQVTSVSAFARLFFIGLWTVADREGRLQWAPRKLKAQIFPYDDVEVYRLAEELTAAGLMHIYEINGETFAWIPGFTKHQRPHPKEPATTIPACPEGHDPKDIPWNRAMEPLKETASRETPGSIPSSPARKGMDKGNGSMESGSMEEGTERVSPPPPPRPPTLVRKRKPWNHHEGERIEVPATWHFAHVKKLGLEDAEAKLMAWYEELDAQLVRSRRPVGNWFKWLDACYEPWATDLAVSDELERFRPKGA